MLRLRTLGVVSLERDRAVVTGRSTQRKRIALLALLAAARYRPVSRDRVLAYLWPERDAERARHTLSQALYALRQELGEDVIVAGVDELRLNEVAVTSDVADFQTALEEGETERALSLYGGPFLDGLWVADAPDFEQWADGERQRLALLCSAALDRMADASRAIGDHARAVDLLRRRAALDPLNPRAAARLMDALEAVGDHVGALRHARTHTSLLRDQLDVPPDPEVSARAERLHGRMKGGAASAPPVGAPSSTPMSPAAVSFASGQPASAAVAPRVPSRPITRSAAWRALRPSWLSVARAAVAVVLLAAPLWIAFRVDGATSAVTPRGILLGNVQGPSPELALAVEEVLRAELAAAPELRLAGEVHVREALRLMALPGATPLTPSVVREIAIRRGLPFVVSGTAVPVGRGTTIRVVLVDAAPGTEIATLSSHVERTEEIIPAVARLARELRRRVSRSTLAASSDSLPAVTTTSLPALKNYAAARQALGRLDRTKAIALLEAALEHDSLFALGHLLVGDLLWYVDNQQHAEAHLTTAHTLSGLLPPRERLIVRARYEQLVRDRLDSALTYWDQVRVSYPEEVQAYQGLIWTYNALGDPARATEVMDAALRLDSASLNAQLHHRLGNLVSIGDSARALAFARTVTDRWPKAELEARVLLASERGDWSSVLRMQDSARVAAGDTSVNGAAARQITLLALGRIDEAAVEAARIVRAGVRQYPPRALLLQAQAEARQPGRVTAARGRAREAMRWLAGADLSAPAIARLAERIAVVAAYTGDPATIEAARRYLRQRDGGRGLHSYRAALTSIDAAAAFARGDMSLAARLTEESLPLMYLGRSNGTAALLAADARAAAGDRAGADAMYRRIVDPRGLRDNDHETLWVLRALARAGI